MFSLADGPLRDTAFSRFVPLLIGALFTLTMSLIAGTLARDAWRGNRGPARVAAPPAQPVVDLAD